MIKLTLPLPPSANRYWRIFRNRAVVSKEAQAYKRIVRYLVSKDRAEPVISPIRVELDVYRARKAGDLDNFLKVTLDALNGAAWGDDSQIVELRARRFDDKQNPRVEVTVEELPQWQA